MSSEFHETIEAGHSETTSPGTWYAEAIGSWLSNATNEYPIYSASQMNKTYRLNAGIYIQAGRAIDSLSNWKPVKPGLDVIRIIES